MLEKPAGLQCVPQSCTGAVHGGVPVGPNRDFIAYEPGVMVLVCNTPHAVCNHIRFGCVGLVTHVLTMRAITVSTSGQEIALGASHGMAMLFDIRVALSVSA